MKKQEFLIYLKLFIRPIIIGLGISAFWHQVLYRFGLSILESDESAFTDAGVPVLAMFHAIIAGHVLSKVLDEYTRIQVCIREEDIESFRTCINNRIPILVHMLLGSLSVIIMILTMLIHFDVALAGISLNFSVAFVLVLYWEVATNLDNPYKGVWYVNSVPKDWLEQR